MSTNNYNIQTHIAWKFINTPFSEHNNQCATPTRSVRSITTNVHSLKTPTQVVRKQTQINVVYFYLKMNNFLGKRKRSSDDDIESNDDTDDASSGNHEIDDELMSDIQDDDRFSGGSEEHEDVGSEMEIMSDVEYDGDEEGNDEFSPHNMELVSNVEQDLDCSDDDEDGQESCLVNVSELSFSDDDDDDVPSGDGGSFIPASDDDNDQDGDEEGIDEFSPHNMELVSNVQQDLDCSDDDEDGQESCLVNVSELSFSDDDDDDVPSGDGGSFIPASDDDNDQDGDEEGIDEFSPHNMELVSNVQQDLDCSDDDEDGQESCLVNVSELSFSDDDDDDVPSGDGGSFIPASDDDNDQENDIPSNADVAVDMEAHTSEDEDDQENNNIDDDLEVSSDNDACEVTPAEPEFDVGAGKMEAKSSDSDHDIAPGKMEAESSDSGHDIAPGKMEAESSDDNFDVFYEVISSGCDSASSGSSVAQYVTFSRADSSSNESECEDPYQFRDHEEETKYLQKKKKTLVVHGEWKSHDVSSGMFIARSGYQLGCEKCNFPPKHWTPKLSTL